MSKKDFSDVLRVRGILAMGFGVVPKAVMLDDRLTIEAKAIYNYFSSYAGSGDTAFPSVSKVIYDLKVSKTRYYKHFKLLVDYGYITVEDCKRNNKFSNNIYVLNDFPYPQNKETVSCPQNEDTRYEDTRYEDSNINNININNFNNILDEDDDKSACELAEVENEFKKYYSKKITPIIHKTLKELLDVANKDLLLYSIGKLQDVDKPIAYLKAIIKNYLQNDIQTVEQAKVFDDKYKSKRKTKVKTDNTVPSGGVTVPNHFYYDWMNDLEDEEGIKKDYQSQNQNL